MFARSRLIDAFVCLGEGVNFEDLESGVSIYPNYPNLTPHVPRGHLADMGLVGDRLDRVTFLMFNNKQPV